MAKRRLRSRASEMDFLERAAARVSHGLALIGAVGVVTPLLHVGLDVVTPNLFGPPIPATGEIVSRRYALLIALPTSARVDAAGRRARSRCSAG